MSRVGGETSPHAMLPLRADPAAGALIGTVLVFGLLMLPGSLVVLLIGAFVIAIARSLRSHRKPKANIAVATERKGA